MKEVSELKMDREAFMATLEKEKGEHQNEVASQLACKDLEVRSLEKTVGELRSEVAYLTTSYETMKADMQYKDKLRDRGKGEAALVECRSAHQQVISELKHQNSILQGEKDQQIMSLIRDNHLLQSKYNEVFAEFSAATEKEERDISVRHELEADLAMEKANFSKLKECYVTLKSEFTTARQELTETSSENNGCFNEPSTSVPFREHDAHFKFPTSERVVQVHDKVPEEVEEFVDEKARLKELKRRNRQALPHLKSSYPIEMQVQPETPTTTDDRLKHGSRRGKVKQNPVQPHQRAPTPTENPEAGSSGSTRILRKRTRDSQTPSGPPQLTPTSRKVSGAPPTPQTDYRRKPVSMENQSLCPSLHLREYLSGTDTTASSELQTNQIPCATAFDIAFSPPAAKGSVPKRLQDNRYRHRTIKESSSDVGARRETVVKSAVGESSKSNRARGKKRVLRPRS